MNRPTGLEVPTAAGQSSWDKRIGGGPIFAIVRPSQTKDTGVEDDKTLDEPVLNAVSPAENNPGSASNESQPTPEGPRFRPSKWDGRGVWKKSDGHWWRPATDPKLISIQEIAR
jgi:hypothetical protein